MSSARQVPRDEDMAAMVKISRLSVNRQITQDGLVRQVAILSQGGLSGRTDSAYDSAAHPSHPLCELPEVTL
jgi:hypothetical protein